MPITKEDIKELLIFTRGEKKGIIVLFILIFILIIINQFAYLFYKENTNDFSEFKKEIADFEKSLIPSEKKNTNISYIERKYDTLKLFSFNPNTTSKKEWKLLGLSEKQIKIVGNYINKGGKFKYKTDFQRIYGISETQFEKLYPFIDLPEKTNYKKTDYNKYDKPYKKNFEKKVTDYTIPDVAEYSKFNPNEISDEKWNKLGFSNKQIATIRNYLNKGGKFYKEEDLKKIYGIKDFQYERIKSYIEIPEKDNKTEYKKEEKHSIVKQKVDINNLSINEMKKLGRFWKYNATRIVKYRNWLGGFYKKEQLLEVYGIKKDYYLKIADDVIIDKSKLKKINLNFAEVSELGRHPYLTYDEANKILDYRNKKGPFKKLNDLLDKDLISKELFNKVKPYLKIK